MALAPRFSNRPNVPYEVAPGDLVFASRSVAVLAPVIARLRPSGSFHVLAGERGSAVDESGRWCLVCGYLDWDEDLRDAVRREVWEEAGLDLAALEAAGTALVPEQPVLVHSDPRSHRQNVTAHFPVEVHTDELPPVSLANAEPGEVRQVAWLELTERVIRERSWAFEHDELLLDVIAFLQRERDAASLDHGSVRRYYRSQIEARYPFTEGR
jgi:ADP-ribose pyrophosphatase YjhB (NUDIX family)